MLRRALIVAMFGLGTAGCDEVSNEIRQWRISGTTQGVAECVRRNEQLKQNLTKTRLIRLCREKHETQLGTHDFVTGRCYTYKSLYTGESLLECSIRNDSDEWVLTGVAATVGGLKEREAVAARDIWLPPDNTGEVTFPALEVALKNRVLGPADSWVLRVRNAWGVRVRLAN